MSMHKVVVHLTRYLTGSNYDPQLQIRSNPYI
jgi:hypothetical protein